MQSNSLKAAPRSDVGTVDNANTLLSDVRAKWSKFSEIELSNLKSVDDLATQIASKYSINPADARQQAEAVMNNRQF